MGKWPSTAVVAIFVTLAIAMTSITPAVAHSRLKVGFYDRSCPEVETIVYNSIRQSYNADNSVAPGVLRMAFHDCFVRVSDRFDLRRPSQLERFAGLAVGRTWVASLGSHWDRITS